MTPASIIVDGPFCVSQSAALGRKCFRNSGGGNAGPQTIRWGLEQSRNLMTVRTASTVGMPKVIKTFERMGIGSYKPYLAFALGAGETTLDKMTNAYSMLVNHGRELKPRLIDYVQDRNGKVILPEKWKACGGCNMKDWDGKPMPRFKNEGRQMMDPVTAFQMVHIMEGVIQRGTAKLLRDMNRPVFGKTGTTTGPKDVWFVGGTPDLVTGVYMGFDEPKDMGGYAQGGTITAPIFKQFMKYAVADMPVRPFVAPKGVRMVRIERRGGKRVYTGWPTSNDGDSAIIWEAFKADSEPRRSARKDELPAAATVAKPKSTAKSSSGTATSNAPAKKQAAPKDNEFLQQQGGIYYFWFLHELLFFYKFNVSLGIEMIFEQTKL
jgi:penicillin-binding protein 1A